MVFLFRSGTFRQKALQVFKATRRHAYNLAFFALTYKSSMIALRATNGGKENDYDTFLAGLAGGYFVFGRGMHSSVNQQIVIYVFARVCLAIAKLIVMPKKGAADLPEGMSGGMGLVTDPKIREMLQKNAWPAMASISWAMVMYIFRWHPETIQPSLRSSMTYMWVPTDPSSNISNANNSADTSIQIIGTV
jgi:hypothetical protein